MADELQAVIQKFAEVSGISYEEAERTLHAATVEEALANIRDINLKKIYAQLPPLNRKQRRAMAKKAGKPPKEAASVITETARKLNYIDLIQKFRDLNKEKENSENDERPSETNVYL